MRGLTRDLKLEFLCVVIHRKSFFFVFVFFFTNSVNKEKEVLGPSWKVEIVGNMLEQG